MTNTVRPAMRRSMAACTKRSLTVSSALVASSRIRIGESCKRARELLSSGDTVNRKCAYCACARSFFSGRDPRKPSDFVRAAEKHNPFCKSIAVAWTVWHFRPLLKAALKQHLLQKFEQACHK